MSQDTELTRERGVARDRSHKIQDTNKRHTRQRSLETCRICKNCQSPKQMQLGHKTQRSEELQKLQELHELQEVNSERMELDAIDAKKTGEATIGDASRGAYIWDAGFG
ncbi:jg5115 [Pararge aegeria aegeria]|uniref:Jg5115 protein n=1 Tax=Pararge aegeria aegeria TaxID=348720 RepID=A0A8S4S129_9NEOP|nr:jg5115 [Pararge aegeria aegeria]